MLMAEFKKEKQPEVSGQSETEVNDGTKLVQILINYRDLNY
jgi:hypothetical protein